MVRGRAFSPLLVVVFLACGDATKADSTADETSAESSSESSSDGGATVTTSGGDGSNGGECILWLADDCAVGEKCMPWSAADDRIPDTNKCCPEAGAVNLPGDECSTDDYDGSCLDDCAAGSMCVVDNQDSLTGVCQPFCDPNDMNSCGQTEVCKAFFEMIEEAATVPLCMAKCDPLVQDCQDKGRPGWSCLPEGLSDPDFLCTPPPETARQEFEGCLLGNDCEPGLACTIASTVLGCDAGLFCCTSYCDLNEPNPCLMGNSCISLGVTDPALTHVGLCGVPQ